MVFSKTLLKVSDNSGVKYAKCLKVLQTKSASGKLNYGSVGDIILVSSRVCSSTKTIKKGDVFKAVIVRSKRTVKRDVGLLFFKENAVVLLNKKMLPEGTRVFGPISLEVRRRNFSKISALATLVI
jgi:large subunit ribosomal protein L14